jgi:hypothetical protein
VLSYIAQAFSFITPSKRLALLFCNCVLGADTSMQMPLFSAQQATSSLTITILLSVLIVFITILN